MVPKSDDIRHILAYNGPTYCYGFGNSHYTIKVPRWDISVSSCVVSPIPLYRGNMCDLLGLRSSDSRFSFTIVILVHKATTNIATNNIYTLTPFTPRHQQSLHPRHDATFHTSATTISTTRHSTSTVRSRSPRDGWRNGVAVVSTNLPITYSTCASVLDKFSYVGIRWLNHQGVTGPLENACNFAVLCNAF